MSAEQSEKRTQHTRCVCAYKNIRTILQYMFMYFSPAQVLCSVYGSCV